MGFVAQRTLFWPALWALTVALFAAAAVPPLVDSAPNAPPRLLYAALGVTFAACGLIARRRRPDHRSGQWMLAAGFGFFVAPVLLDFDSPTVEAISDRLNTLWAVPMIALLVSFAQGGRLEGTVDRVLVGAIAAAIALQWVAAAAFVAAAFACLGTVVTICVRFARASPPRRRAMLPSVAGIAALLFAAASLPTAAPEWVAWLAVLALLLVPVAFLVSLLRSRLARADLSTLFGLRGAELQARLAEAVGDPSLVIAYGAPGSFADAHGRPVAVGAGRSVAALDHAALVYDRSLDHEPGLIEAAASATAIALEQERLRSAQQRLIDAGDTQRRRLERDLHDGAQQRLVAVAMQLRLIEADIHSDPAAAAARVATASDELARSLEELRELARGIHPAVLEHGLAPALTTLAARSPVPCAVACSARDVPRPVELALYFVACEALANVAKHARASAASVSVERGAGGLAIEIADDGVGGARASGSGLRGLADRVEALGGHLGVTSPAGAGTVVRAELPCGS